MTFSDERFFDLIRYKRFDLYNEGLITDDEFAILAESHESVKRLESYDNLRAKLVERDKVIAECRRLGTYWTEREKNSPYGYDEYGMRIPTLSGNDCAKELAAILQKFE